MKRLHRQCEARGLNPPPARYSEATCSARWKAPANGRRRELRAAMHEKGLGTPATRSSIIEGLLAENTCCVRAARQSHGQGLPADDAAASWASRNVRPS